MKTRKLRLRDLVVLSLPVVGLIAIALATSRHAPLILWDCKVVTTPYLNNTKPPSTQVMVELKYGHTLLQSRANSFDKIKCSPELTYLQDATGAKYQIPIWGASFEPVEEWTDRFISSENKVFTFIYDVGLGKIPKSRGTVTFHTTFTTDDGSRLPVTVTVRA